MDKNINTTHSDLENLRRLLLEPEKNRLDDLEQLLDDPEQQAQSMSKVLPNAINLSRTHNSQLATELFPVVEEAIKVSVQKDSQIFADTLFPVMGPAIRKSMSEALRQMAQSINQAIEYSFSWKGLKWRFEAWRSGKSLADIILLHSLVYRVEQIFLIHKETGILLKHLALNEVKYEDADLVSAMLTAIQDFVNDSFQVNNEHSLNQMSLGNFSVWIEQSPDVIVAVAIRGSAPEELRHNLIAVLEKIHHKCSPLLNDFEGDVTPFSVMEEPLNALFLCQYEAKEKKFSWLTKAFWACLIIIFLSGLFFYFQEQRQWQNYLQLIKSEPGIVITDVAKKEGGYFITGLRDPLARHENELLSESLLTAAQVTHSFQPYQSLTESFILKRAIKLLKPPEGVNIQLKQGILFVSGLAELHWIKKLTEQSHYISGLTGLDDKGLFPIIDLSLFSAPDSVKLTVVADHVIATGSASYDWINAARLVAKKIPGVVQYDDSQLQFDIDVAVLEAPEGVRFDFNQGRLVISGQAPNLWMVNLQQKALSIPGVESVNIASLVNLDLQLFYQLKNELEEESIYYAPGQSSVVNNDPKVQQVLSKVQLLSQLSDNLSQPYQIIIQGYSDSIGLYRDRVTVAYLRAERMKKFFITNGINESLLDIQNMMIKEEQFVSKIIQDEHSARKVSFLVRFSEPEGEI